MSDIVCDYENIACTTLCSDCISIEPLEGTTSGCHELCSNRHDCVGYFPTADPSVDLECLIMTRKRPLDTDHNYFSALESYHRKIPETCRRPTNPLELQGRRHLEQCGFGCVMGWIFGSIGLAFLTIFGLCVVGLILGCIVGAIGGCCEAFAACCQSCCARTKPPTRQDEEEAIEITIPAGADPLKNSENHVDRVVKDDSEDFYDETRVDGEPSLVVAEANISARICDVNESDERTLSAEEESRIRQQYFI